jgi:redox-sensing transcriptional repressor
MGCKTVKVDKLPTIRRLPAYLHLLRALLRKGEEFVSSSYLAEAMNLESILVRKDLELNGISGTPGVGYFVPELVKSIEEFLGWGDSVDTFLIGVGQLGTALLGYKDLEQNGLKIIAAFDNDPAKINKSIHGIRVFNVSRLPELLLRLNVRLAILTTPPEEAQAFAEILVDTGIKGIWNFTPANLNVPDGVIVQKEDLVSGLAVLSVKMARVGTTERNLKESLDENKNKNMHGKLLFPEG